ncbi:hypothetical protein C0Q88_25970 [Ralstonia pickettii]|uniref:Transmembrane protein n=2 Tax=Ralstonia pickettii TaxID=329 RepID=A0A2N4TJH2_RALPI|nr:hypothetical protein C0Q88_25970 [Ralstonia pickettii]
MSGQQYLMYRLRLIGLVCIWLVTMVLVYLFWGQLGLIAKALLFVLWYAFLPTIGTLEQIVTPYEKYLKEGI